MAAESSLSTLFRKMLETGDLTFRDFMEVALYHPTLGYYSGGGNPVGKGGDYVTAPTLSPLFGACLSELVREFVSRCGDVPSTIVDVGCGDGGLINTMCPSTGQSDAVHFVGVDRSLARATANGCARFVETIDQVSREGAHLVISNELFDAFPFTRLVQRDEHLHELWVTERESQLDWVEHEAPTPWEDYFSERGISLLDGQFADVSREWGAYYAELCGLVTRGLIVTFDYGFPEKQLFDPRARRFGTAASYAAHRVSRDLLSTPGERDLTAHINFSDLIRAGEKAGFQTLFFGRQAQFLLALGAAGHELLRPIEEGSVATIEDALQLQQRREEARRLVLPDGIGEEIRVLVQSRGLEVNGWSFQRDLFGR